MKAVAEGRPGAWKRRLTLTAVLALIGLFYVFLVSAGRLKLPWPKVMDFYDMLAESFRAGHLYLPIAPDPRLVSAANPFDRSVARYWLIDATLYGDKYYLYWGPAPAVLQAVVKSLFSIRGLIGDHYIAFTACCLNALNGAFFIRRLACRFGAGVPAWQVWLAIVAFGFTSPTPFLLAGAGIYQAAILAAQSFLFAGLACAFEAVWEPAWSRRRDWLLAAAGACFALAISSRISLALAVGPLMLATVLTTTLTERARVRRFFSDSVWLGVPVLLGVAALLIYNKLRFDAWLDFGMERAVSYFPFRYSKSYLFPNFESYFIRAPAFSCSFPFIAPTITQGAAPLSDWLGLPPGYLVMEPTIGVAYAAPLLFLVPSALSAVKRRLGPGLCAPSITPMGELAQRRRAYLWLVGALLLATLPIWMSAGIFFSTNRYEADFMTGLALLALLGLFVNYGRSGPTRRRVRAVVANALLGVTIVAGILTGYQERHFKTFNPELHHKLVQTLSVCGAR